MSEYGRVRRAAVAGRFYDAEPEHLREMVIQLTEVDEPVGGLPSELLGAVVPHAGYLFSGAVAGRAIRRLFERSEAVTVLLTGAIHTPVLTYGPTLDSADAWATPLGVVGVDLELRNRIAGIEGVSTLDMAHESEHSLEVELPLLQHVVGERLKIVPCLVPMNGDAPKWGEAIGEVLKDYDEPVVTLASSDFTHYGPNYRFMPEGVGTEAIAWAHEKNDRALIEIIESMEAERVVPEVSVNKNACGAGSIATTMNVVKQLRAGARAVTLEHTSSSAVLEEMGESSDEQNSVGYAGIVFG